MTETDSYYLFSSRLPSLIYNYYLFFYWLSLIYCVDVLCKIYFDIIGDKIGGNSKLFVLKITQ